MDVNLLLGTEQALMLHSISTNNKSIPKLEPHSQHMFCTVVTRKPCLHDGIPYSGNFSYGANFRIFRMKPRDTKIKTTKILTIEILTSNFEWAIEHV